MFDPFLEVSRRVELLRGSAERADAWASSPFAAVVLSLSFGFPLAGLSLAAAGRGFSAFPQLSISLAVLALLLLVSGPTLRLVERVRLSRMRLFSGSDDSDGSYDRIRDVHMGAVVRAFALIHPNSFTRHPPRAYSPAGTADGGHRMLAERMLHALEGQRAGDRLHSVMLMLAHRVEAFSDSSVPASALLDALDALPSDRSGLAQGIAWRLSAEVWDPVFGVAYRRIASDFLESLLRVSAMSDTQVDSLRALMQTPWAGSVEDLLAVAEHVGR